MTIYAGYGRFKAMTPEPDWRAGPHEYSRQLEEQVETLKAENAQLRAVLEEIATKSASCLAGPSTRDSSPSKCEPVNPYDGVIGVPGKNLESGFGK